jgi:hypothetical protein
MVDRAEMLHGGIMKILRQEDRTFANVRRLQRIARAKLGKPLVYPTSADAAVKVDAELLEGYPEYQYYQGIGVIRNTETE